MKEQILYTVAIDKNGKLIKAKDAEKGDSYSCPICKDEVILRKSGNTGKGSKRPHFAHHALTPNCTPETALHYAFKNLLASKVEQHLESKKALPISWLCEYCFSNHSGDLLKKIKSVKIEHNLIACKPDIALLGNDGNVHAVIEVVVTHKPEESALKYYQANNIVLIQINVTSDKDIDDLENKISNPDIVRACFNPKCEDCGNHKHKVQMTIVDGFCWKCGAAMKAAIIEDGQDRDVEFTNEEIQFAKSKDAIIQLHYSQTVHRKYLANSCTSCDAFVGNHYLDEQFLEPAMRGEYEFETYDISYYCNYCLNSGEGYTKEFDEEHPQRLAIARVKIWKPRADERVSIITDDSTGAQ